MQPRLDQKLKHHPGSVLLTLSALMALPLLHRSKMLANMASDHNYKVNTDVKHNNTNLSAPVLQ